MDSNPANTTTLSQTPLGPGPQSRLPTCRRPGLVFLAILALIFWQPLCSVAQESLPDAWATAVATQSAGKHKDAIPLFRDLLGRMASPSDTAHCQLRLAISLARSDHRENAAEANALFQSLVTDTALDEHFCETALYEAAWLSFDLGQPELAKRHLQEMVSRYPDSRYASDSHFRLAKLLLDEGDRDAARHHFQKAMTADRTAPLATWAQFELAQLTAGDGDWANALPAFVEAHQRSLQQGDTSLRKLIEYGMAECHFQMGQNAAALQLLEPLMKSPLPERRLQQQVALRVLQCHARRDDWSAVRRAVQQFSAQSPSLLAGPEYRFLMARESISRAAFDEARETLANLVADTETTQPEMAAQAMWLTGETWFLQERFDKALDCYQQVRGRWHLPRWQTLAALQSAKCLTRLGNTDTARVVLDQVLDQYPESELDAEIRQFRHALISSDAARARQAASQDDTRIPQRKRP